MLSAASVDLEGAPSAPPPGFALVALSTEGDS